MSTISNLQGFRDPERALLKISDIYSASQQNIQEAFDAFTKGQLEDPVTAFYPGIQIEIQRPSKTRDKRESYGFMTRPGTYTATITRPDIFEGYLLEQFKKIMSNHDVQIQVGVSDIPIPYNFAFRDDYHPEGTLTDEQQWDIPYYFTAPSALDAQINNDIVDGKFDYSSDEMPLSLFAAPRVDKSLNRIAYYTGTKPEFFQDFIIFTNYADYIQRFRDMAKNLFSQGETDVKNKMGKGSETAYLAFIEPGNVITFNENIPNAREKFDHASGNKPFRLPQMPAYHLVREDGKGISMTNIGVGPSNAANMTDHLAVLRPDAFLMLGHCAGLTDDQRLGDYVLANAYDRRDRVLDDYVPLNTPIPALAEVQLAIKAGMAKAFGMGQDPDKEGIKDRYRTGTVVSEANRNWEEDSRNDLIRRFQMSRAVGLDMESATIAANGYRYRIPYGTLLCISDKPLPGQIKLAGMTNKFYQDSVAEHFWAGVHTMEALRQEDSNSLHSRKLRSFLEPALR